MPHDPTEAPAGYRAELKRWTPQTGNICKQCDWRTQCNDPATDLLAPGHRCMKDPVVANGTEYQRADKSSVLFKKL